MLTCVRKKIEQGLVRHNDIQYTCTAPSLQRRIRWHYQNKTFLVSIITEVDTNIARISKAKKLSSAHINSCKHIERGFPAAPADEAQPVWFLFL